MSKCDLDCQMGSVLSAAGQETSYAKLCRWVFAAGVGFGLAAAPAIASAATVSFTWTPNPPEEQVLGYKLYYDTDSGHPYEGTQANEGPSPIDVPVATLPDPDKPSVQVSGLPSCTVFYFALTAYSAEAESDYTQEESARVVAAPASVTASSESATSLQITWTAPPDDDDGVIPRFFVHYATQSGEPYGGQGSPFEVATSSMPDPANPSYVLTGLSTGTTYYIAVESGCNDDARKMSTETTGVPEDSGTGGGGGAAGSAGAGATGGTGGTAGSGGSDTTGGTGGDVSGGSGGSSAGAAGSSAGAAGSSAGTGGSSAGTGGSSAGTGGSSAGTGGSSPIGGNDTGGDEAGCSCRVPAPPTSPAAPVGLLLLGLAIARRRTRN